MLFATSQRTNRPDASLGSYVGLLWVIASGLLRGVGNTACYKEALKAVLFPTFVLR